jgi:hypothetical protein
VIERPSIGEPAATQEPEPPEVETAPEPETEMEWIEVEIPEPPEAEPDAASVDVEVPDPLTPEPVTPANPEPARRVRIAEVAREKFEASGRFEEIRGARVVVRPRRSLGDIDPGDVHVELTFYDRDEFTGKVAPTTVPGVETVHDLGATWPAGEAKNLEYRYEVPKGFRTGDMSGHTYYGHLVRLYYRGKLEDVYAFPESLLDL